MSRIVSSSTHPLTPPHTPTHTHPHLSSGFWYGHLPMTPHTGTPMHQKRTKSMAMGWTAFSSSGRICAESARQQSVIVLNLLHWEPPHLFVGDVVDEQAREPCKQGNRAHC
jgi:hypothetical protein